MRVFFQLEKQGQAVGGLLWASGRRVDGRGRGGGGRVRQAAGIKTHLTFLASKRQMLWLDERAACNTQKFLAGG